jgi:hypothetical protein
MRPIKYVLTFAALLICRTSHAQLIIDESYKDESFWTFKAELESCLLNRDKTKLKSMLADTVYESKDGCGNPGCSKDEFIEYCFNDDDDQDTWEEMLRITRFGFHRYDSLYQHFLTNVVAFGFQAPSYLKTINTDDEIIVLGENVNIREKPSKNAKVIAKASFEKFKCDCNILTSKETTYQTADGIDWLEIYLPNGHVGYIAEKYTSYNVIKELTVVKIKGAWKIVSYSHAPGC